MFRDREPKYPGLAAAIRASGSGVAYMTAYQRLLRGYSWEKAINTPTHVKRVRPPKKRREIISVHELKSLFAWERPAWNAKARAERALAFAPVGRNPLAPKRGRKIRKRYIPKANDTSPDHIRKIRAEFCAEFVKTGNLNTTLMAKLKDYADECHRSHLNSQRLAAELKAQGTSPDGVRIRDNSVRDDHSVDGPQARSEPAADHDPVRL